LGLQIKKSENVLAAIKSVDLWGSPVPALTGCGSGLANYLEINNRHLNKLLHATPTSPTQTPTQHFQAPTPTLQAIFFFDTSFPPNGGVGWGRAQQLQQKSTAAAVATAARQGQNEINTAMARNRLRACEVFEL
jgi:hypothetical protein